MDFNVNSTATTHIETEKHSFGSLSKICFRVTTKKNHQTKKKKRKKEKKKNTGKEHTHTNTHTHTHTHTHTRTRTHTHTHTHTTHTQCTFKDTIQSKYVSHSSFKTNTVYHSFVHLFVYSSAHTLSPNCFTPSCMPLLIKFTNNKKIKNKKKVNRSKIRQR